MSVALEGLQEDGYRIGDLQALRYDRNVQPFFDGYLGKLYNLCAASKRRSGDGILTALFGGNPPSNFDAIVGYLAQRPVVVLGEWKDGTFVEAGFCFPIITCGTSDTERSMFAGYGFFKPYWGTPELPVLAMLGLSYLFQEFDLKAIHGTRYRDNVLTWNFTKQFGFKEIGEIPHYQLRNGKLVSGVVTSLDRGDFERYVENWLVEQYRAANPVEPSAESVVAPTATILEMPAPAPPPPAPAAPVDFEAQLPLSWL